MSISLIDKNFGFKNVLVEVALCSAKLIRVEAELGKSCFVLLRLIMWFVKGESLRWQKAAFLAEMV